jgi:nucleoside-diphosphate-sugar epimerase
VSSLRAAGRIVNTPGRGDGELYRKPLGHVIYAIGVTADFRRRPYDTVQAHVGVLADFLQRADFESLLYLSSTRVYARASSGNEDVSLPVLAQDPDDLYNLTKLMGESLCQQDPRVGIRVARLSNVVGGDDVDSANFVPSLFRDAHRGRIVLQTAANSAKDYIHIDDVVELLPKIAATGRQRLYNVASGVSTTHRQWAEYLATVTGCVVEVADGAPLVRFAPIDIRRIQTEFDFHPRPVITAFGGAHASARVPS